MFAICVHKTNLISISLAKEVFGSDLGSTTHAHAFIMCIRTNPFLKSDCPDDASHPDIVGTIDVYAMTEAY